MSITAEMESITSKHPVTPGELLPADELLADMLLTLNKPIETLASYQLNLKRCPNRFNGVYGTVAKQSGDLEKYATILWKEIKRIILKRSFQHELFLQNSIF